MTDKDMPQPITYATSGVDVEAGDDAVELMKSAVTATHSNRVLGGFGGFAGMWDATPLTSYRRPVLTTSTDGVGTKVAIAQPWTFMTPSARTWWAWWLMTSSSSGPNRCL